MNDILNISSYKFVQLTDLPELRERLHDQTIRLGLKGTILIAEEGINLFLAGSARAIQAFVSWLKSDSRFADLNPKEQRALRAAAGGLRRRGACGVGPPLHRRPPSRPRGARRRAGG